MPDLNKLSAADIAKGIAAKKFTAEAVVRDCLDRIAAREPTVHAFATIDPDYALMQARALDRMPSSRGALHGVPIGVKDIIDTEHLPTEMGSPIYKGHRSAGDAACVALARMAGAVILGKTVTAEFAGMFPGPTANPHNPAHTPGGSSSGSAAAVADFMVPVAYGTQTGGSVLRPASYCGCVGYKPTFNLINRQGISFAAETLDTIGLLTRTVDDAELVTAVLVNKPPAYLQARLRRRGSALCRTPLWDTADDADQARGRGRGQAARRRRRVGEGDRAAGGIREALLHRARDHQQLRALEEHGRRLAASSGQDQQGAGRSRQEGLRDEARGLCRGAAACRSLPRAHRRRL